MATSKSLKTSLQNTTALIGAAFLVTQASEAMAANTTLTPGAYGTQTMNTGDNLTVQNGATISDTVGVIVGTPTTSEIAGFIHNAGVIHGSSSTGILLNTSSQLTGGIINTGTIFGNEYGIRLRTSSSISNGIANNGALAVISGNSNGIYIQNGSTINGDITNSGLIHGDSTAGIQLISNSVINGDINNSGTISGDDYGINVRNSSTIDGAVVNDADGTISGGSDGIRVSTNSNLTGGIDNSGTISGGIDGIAIFNTSDLSGGINNQAGAHISGSTRGIRLDTNGRIFGGIDNAGTIHGGTVGITLEDTSSINGVLTNSGTIDGNNYGIRVNGSSSIVDGIVNTADGNIHGNTGIFVQNSSSISAGVSDFAIENSGDITGDSGHAILVNNSGSITGGIRNHDSGTIHGGSSSTSAAGIYLDTNGSITGGIVNSGTISGDGDGIALFQTASITGNVDNTGNITGGDGSGILVSTSTITGNINNTTGLTEASGSVATHGTISGGSIGINVNNGTIDGDINNDASGDNIAMISGGNTGIGLYNGADVTGDVTNAGTVQGFFDGIVLRSSTIDGGITNTGTIQATKTGAGGVGIGVYTTSDVTGGITNSGTISGSTGIDIETSIVTGGITNNVGGTIESTNGGNAIYMNGLAAEQDIFIAGGHIVGDVTDFNFGNGWSVVDVTGDFATEGNFQVGDLTVDNTKTLTISPTNTVTLDTMSPSAGTFDFGIHTAANGEHGEIVVDDDAADLSGNVVNGITAHVYGNTHINDGDQILIVSGTNTIVGGALQEGVVGDNSQLLWDFTAVLGDNLALAPTNNSELYLVATSTIDTVDGITQNEINVAAALDAMDEPVGAEGLQAVLDNIAAADVAGDADALTDTLESVLPTVDGGAEEGIIDASVDTQGVVETRLASARSGDGTSGMAAGASGNGYSMWLQGYGRSANQDRRDTVDGYDADTWGGAVGIDSTNVISNGVVGVMFNYGTTNVDSKNVNTTSTDIDTFGVNLFASTDLSHSAFLDAQLGYAYNSIESDRHNVNLIAGNTAHADYHSDLWSAKVAVGNDYPVDGNMTLTPIASAAYTYLDNGSYTETGSTANLSVNSDNRSALNLGIGLNAGWNLKGDNGAIVKPALHVGYAYDVIGDRLHDASSFVDDPANNVFITEGASVERSSFNVGAGLSYLTTANFDLSANYDYKYKQDYAAHTGILRATGHF
jgi:outer membrane autotransporter protein